MNHQTWDCAIYSETTVLLCYPPSDCLMNKRGVKKLVNLSGNILGCARVCSNSSMGKNLPTSYISVIQYITGGSDFL